MPSCRQRRHVRSTSSGRSHERGLWPNEFGRLVLLHDDLSRSSCGSTPTAGESRATPVPAATRRAAATWFYWLRQPACHPDGHTFALVLSDGPDPTQSTSSSSSSTRDEEVTRAERRQEIPPLGHQDPAWRPDGKTSCTSCNDQGRPPGRPVDLALQRRDRQSLRRRPGPATRPVVLARREVLRRDEDDAVRDRRRHPRRETGARGAPRSRRTASPGRRSGRRPGDAIAFLHVRRPDRRPADGQPRPARRRRSDRRGHDRPDGRLGPRRRVAARRGTSRPTSCRTPSPVASPTAGVAGRVRCAVGEPVAGACRRLPRAARGAVRRPSAPCCAWGSTPTRRHCRPASAATSHGVEAFARLSSSRRPPRSSPRSSRTWRSSRRSGRPGSPRSSGSGRAIPADVPVVVDAKRGDIGIDGRPPGRRAVRRARRGRRHGQPVPRRRARSPRSSSALDRFAYVLCRTSNPGAGELQDLLVAADPQPAARAEPLHAPRRPARRGVGPGRDGRPRRRGDGARRARGDPRGRTGPRLPRPRRRGPGRRDRAGARRRAGDGAAGRRTSRVAGSSSTSRGASPGPRRRDGAAAERPGRGHRRGRPRVGSTTPCAIVAGRKNGPARAGR